MVKTWIGLYICIYIEILYTYFWLVKLLTSNGYNKISGSNLPILIISFSGLSISKSLSSSYWTTALFCGSKKGNSDMTSEKSINPYYKVSCCIHLKIRLHSDNHTS